MDYKTLFNTIPRSDEQIARDLGISSKTIKRLKTGTYKPSTRIELLLLEYVVKMHNTIGDFISNQP